MNEILIFDPIERLLNAMVIFCWILGSFPYFYQACNRKEKADKLLLLGFASVIMSNGISAIFTYFRVLYIIGTYSGHSYIGDPANVTTMYEILRLGQYLSSYAGYLVLFLCFETVIKKTKYFLSSICVVSIILNIIFIDINEILGFINMGMLAAILIWFYQKSNPEFQVITLYLLIGMALIAIGGMFNWRRFQQLFEPHPVIGYPLTILGIFIIILPILMRPESFETKRDSRILSGWAFLLAIDGFMLSIMIMIFFGADLTKLSPENQLDAIRTISLNIVLGIIIIVFCIVQIVRIRHLGKRKITKKVFTEEKDFLKIFTRPQRVTEEEVSISKEKKVCLVCKGKVSRYDIYICPECNSLYHHKCAKVLEDTENACWACETPFDETKPIKIIKEAEEKIDIEDVIDHKKSKTQKQ